jgi:hypothetical protein
VGVGEGMIQGVGEGVGGGVSITGGASVGGVVIPRRYESRVPAGLKKLQYIVAPHKISTAAMQLLIRKIRLFIVRVPSLFLFPVILHLYSCIILVYVYSFRQSIFLFENVYEIEQNQNFVLYLQR